MLFISDQFETFPDYHWDATFARTMTLGTTLAEWTRDYALMMIAL